MRTIDWTCYAQVYDLMAANNPAYGSIVTTLREEMATWHLEPDGPVVDLASGTGNFSVPLARAFPDNPVRCVDSDAEMNRAVRRKAARMGLSNLETQQADVGSARFAPESVSAVVCVHALYTFRDPIDVIRKTYSWLRPGGYVFACDLGRELDLRDWSGYLLREMVRRHGWLHSISAFCRGGAVVQQNRRIARAQRRRKYWTHTHAEFRSAFEAAGFDIVRSAICYRGYSDLVVARKPRRLECAA